MLRLTYRKVSKLYIAQSRFIFKDVLSPESSRKSFLVIPEIAVNKKFINIENINSISPHDIFLDVSKSIQKFDANSAALNAKFNSYVINRSYNFDNTVLEINKVLEEIDSKFKYLKVISSSSDDRIIQLVIYSLFHKINVASQQLLNLSNLSFIINELRRFNLDDIQRRVVDMMKSNLDMFGRNLSKDKMGKVAYDINLLLGYQMSFIESVTKSKLKLQQHIDRSDLSDDTPKWLLSQLKESELVSSYKLNVRNDAKVRELLKYCVNPLVRNQIWLSNRQIGGKIIFNFKSSNYKTITEIRNVRSHISNDLGEENYASFLFNTKSRMAKSLDDVIQLLEVYKSRLLPQAEKEFKELNTYATKEKGLKDSLMMWDNDYIQRCYSLEVLKCPWSKLEAEGLEFNLNRVLERVFCVLHKMFNITFLNKYSRLSEAAFIISTENHVGEIIFKINTNSRKNLVEILPLKIQDDNKTMKISYVIISLPFNNPNIFNCLEIIGNLGKILSYQLGCSDFDISPLHTGLPPDAVNISSQFLLHSFLTSKHLFQYVFPEIDKSKSQDLCDTYISKGLNMSSNMSSLEALYVAYFDIEMWHSNKSWQNIQVELWRDFFGSSSKSQLFYPLERMDEWPCSATDIFADHLWGGLNKYSLFWTDNVIRSLFQKLIKAKFYDWDPNEDINPELNILFQQFQRTFIEERNSVHSFSYN